MNAQLTVDLSKVQYATFYWKTRLFGYVRRTKPRRPTVNGQTVRNENIFGMKNYTTLKYAIDHKILDEWIPTLLLKFSANSSQRFQGKKAQSLWKEFNRRQFKQTNQRK